jgi:hypothetical protein
VWPPFPTARSGEERASRLNKVSWHESVRKAADRLPTEAVHSLRHVVAVPEWPASARLPGSLDRSQAAVLRAEIVCLVGIGRLTLLLGSLAVWRSALTALARGGAQRRTCSAAAAKRATDASLRG